MDKIKELREKQAQIATQARLKINEIKDDTPEDRAAEIEREFDAMMAEHDKIGETIERLLKLEAAEDRSNEPDPRRPSGPQGEVRTDGSRGDTPDETFGLRPEERVATWARASQPENYELSLGEYLSAMVRGAQTDVEKRALAEGTDSAGGYTVPVILSAKLIDLLRANSVTIAAGARTVPLRSDHHNIAKLASDPVPAWRFENAVVTESDPTFTNVPLVPRSLAVMTRISHELFEDTTNLNIELPRVLATSLSRELDRVALMGAGSAPEPRGVENMPGVGTTPHDAALSNYSPFVTARTSILSANAGPVSAIIMHPRDEGTLAGLTATDNQPLMSPKEIAEVPKLTTTAIPTDGGSGSNESTIFMGNFSHLMIGIRSQIRVEVLKERYADQLQYGLIAHMRADIAAEHESAFHTITGVQG